MRSGAPLAKHLADSGRLCRLGLFASDSIAVAVQVIDVRAHDEYRPGDILRTVPGSARAVDVVRDGDALSFVARMTALRRRVATGDE